MAPVANHKLGGLKHILFYHSSKGQKFKVSFTGSKSRCNQDHASFDVSRGKRFSWLFPVSRAVLLGS